MIEDTMMIGGGKMTSKKEEGPAVTERTTLTEESLPQVAAGTLPPPHPMAGDTEHDTGALSVFIKTQRLFL